MALGAQAIEMARKAEKGVAAATTGESRATVSSAVLDSLAPSPIAAGNISALGGGLVRRAIVGQNSPILAMPQEVQQRIFRFAVTHEESIYPVQYAPKSNKFFWSKGQAEAHRARLRSEKFLDHTLSGDEHVDDGPYTSFAPLTAVALSQTCRQMYDSVARTHLFYEENHFDFTEHCNYQIITFLVALTDERRNRIQHLALSVSAYRSIPRSSELFTIIAASKGVKTLRLQFTDTHSGPHPTTWAALKGYKEVFHAVEGLKKVEVFGKVIEPSSTDKEAVTHLEALLKAHMKANPTRGKNFNLGMLQNARVSANLHVHGEGRLSDDKKPGIVSSRTRAATRNLQNLDVNGVLPKRDVPRYNLNGDVAWRITNIKDSREVKSDDGSVLSIEFLVCMYPNFSDMTKIEEAWEDLSVLNTEDAQNCIVYFYQSKNHQNAVGREDVLAIWKLREDVDEPQMWSRIHSLNRVATKQAKKREQQEKREQAEALKAQLRAAKAAAKKSPRTSVAGKPSSKAASSGNGKIATSSAAPVPADPSKGSSKSVHKSVAKPTR